MELLLVILVYAYYFKRFNSVSLCAVIQPNAARAPAPNPALQQGMQTTMSDLDKIAAQIVGLKQKQQQMQQQMQQPPKV